MGVIAILLLASAPVGGLIYWAVQQDKKRTHDLRAFAERLGWSFDPEPAFASVPFPREFELFNQGRHPAIRNLMEGERDGRQIAVFDFSYVMGAGKSRTTHTQTVLHVQSAQMDVPRFALRPEHVFHKIGGLFGYQDIDLENDPAFSGQYLLRGEDEAAIRALFGPEVRDFYDRNAKSCTEAGGADLVFWRALKTVKADELQPLLDAATDLAGRLERAAADS